MRAEGRTGLSLPLHFTDEQIETLRGEEMTGGLRGLRPDMFEDECKSIWRHIVSVPQTLAEEMEEGGQFGARWGLKGPGEG